MSKIDNAKHEFEDYKSNIKSFISQDISESDTRSKVIDFLLKNILGWKENDITREESGPSGYYDYKISIPGFNFIIEAKKNFYDLKFPVNHRKTLISSIYKSNKDVIDQIRKYATDQGIPYGIITNGKQFIALKLFTDDGTDWKKNYCLLFSSFEKVEEDFVEFFNNFSKTAVIENGGFEYDVTEEDIEYRTVFSTLMHRDKELIRNSMSSKISSIIDQIFGEIFSSKAFDDKELIKECFVENEEIKKNRKEIQRLFQDKAPSISEVIPAHNTSSIVKQLKDEIENHDNTNSNFIPPKPIIVIGSKGAGKTTFIKHLFYNNLTKSVIEEQVISYVDLEKIQTNNSDQIDRLITEQILENIYEDYPELNLNDFNVLKRIYSNDIKRKDSGEWKYFKENNEGKYQEKLSNFLEKSKENVEKHLEKINFHLIKDRRKRLIVIIDNADQENDKVQEIVFLYSHSLSKSSFCGVIFSLREGYYYRWRNSPPFDAYESNVYHITAPDYSEVLSKRINYALKKIDVKGKSKGSLTRGTKVTIKNKEVAEFLLSLKNSIFGKDNSEIIDFLSYNTYPNIREGLKFFKSFLVSGHTQVDEYIIREKFRTKEGKSHATVPIHEFVKSIGLQNKLYYNSDISHIYNILKPPLSSNKLFIKYYLVLELVNKLERGGASFKEVPIDSIIEKFLDLGFRYKEIRFAIEDLIKNGLVNTDDQVLDIDWKDILESNSIYVTSKGYYYIKNLVGRFHYFDLVLQDTPIFYETEFENIIKSFPKSDSDGKRSIEKRFVTVNHFIEYLKKYEDQESSRVLKTFGKPTENMKVLYEPDLAKLENVIRRHS